jgi:amino acid transporter
MENLTPASNQYDVPFVKGVILIIAMAPFLYVGFDCIPQAAEEFNFPANKTLMLIFSAIAVGAFIYAALAVVTAAVIPWMEMVNLLDANGNPESWRTGAMIKQALGGLGLAFVVIAVLAGMLTGINGFYMSSSRLLFGMARARMMPKFFAYIHPVHKTPSKGIIFVMCICSIAPFFGREVLNWVVDMAAVGTGVGYFFTCAGAYMVLTKNLMPKSDDDISPIMAAAGALVSLGVIVLQVVPGMPAFLSGPCWAALAVWVAMGAVFYVVAMKRFSHTSIGMVRYLILGDKSQLTPAELEAVADCSTVIDCEIDVLEEEIYEKEHH